MLPRLFFVLLSLFCSITTARAQHSIIKGQIKINSGSPISGVGILLLRFADSSLISTTISDTAGNYQLEHINAEKYFISISSVNYTKITGLPFVVTDNKDIELPVIFLTPAEKKMQEVRVSAIRQKPLIEITADKTVFNVSRSINATGSNAFELLQKSPGVTTDKDDNISLSGKNGVRIYIDGRPLQIEETDLAIYLRSINSADIESIEMIHAPSAKYDASGNAGIINIKLKKNTSIGFNGSLSAGVNFGLTPKTTTEQSINYRNKIVNIFSNYSYTTGTNKNTFNLNRQQNDTIYDQENDQRIKGFTHNIKAGADFFLNKRSTIGFIYTDNFTNNTIYSYSRTPSISVKTDLTERILYAQNIIPGKVKNENINLNYSYADTTGHEINIDVDHGVYQSHKTSFQPNAYFTPYPEKLIYQIDYRNNTPINITINTQKIDFVMPFKKGKLSMGAKLSTVETNNTFNFFQIVKGVDSLDKDRSNYFFYKENVNAGYISYFLPLNKKLNVQTGLRAENTASNSILTRANKTTGANDQVNRNYTDLFPNIAVTYTASDNQLFNLSFSKRIDRPNYSDLNPFETRVDELTYIKGNAFLRPQYTNSLTLTHTFRSIFITALSYSHIKDYSTYVTDSTEITKNFISKMNLASLDIAGINFSVPVDIKPWWNLYAAVNIYNSKSRANFGAEKIINIDITSYSLNAQNTFKLGKGYTAEVSGFYNAPSVSAATFKTKAMGNMDIGLQKKIFHDNATIKLSCTDVLHTLQWNAQSDYNGTHILANSHWESRQLRIYFSYRFGSTQIKQARQRAAGNEDEHQRISSDGGSN